MYDLIAANSVYILGVLGALAFFVEVIVQLTKELPGIVNIPTKAYAIIVSLITCILALFIFTAWQNMAVAWYYIALAVCAAFIVAYLSMYGWDTMKELYGRFVKSGSGNK